jgi:DNA replication protein DnaC
MRRRDIPPTVLDELRRNLERLGLKAMLGHLDEALEQAATLEQGYVAFLAGLVEKEALAKADAATERRMKAAKFPWDRSFEAFDWTFQKGLNVQLVKDLMNLDFVRQGRPVLLLGRPGTGKTHMSIAYGRLAAQRGYRVRFYNAARLLAELYASLADDSTERLIGRLARLDLLVIDDLRHVPVRPEHATLLFDLIEARHLKKATMVSSNLSVRQWGKVLGNPALTASMVDRLMERAHVVNIRKGRSYRTDGPDAAPEDDRPDITDGDDEQGAASSSA